MSLLHQTHRPLEVLLFDDRSSDRSLEDIAEPFRTLFENRGIRFVTAASHRQKAAGAGFARNGAINLASPVPISAAGGQEQQCSQEAYFAFQDADDLSMPRRVELQLARCVAVQAEERSCASRRAANPHCVVLVGCALQRLPTSATPRWTSWINSMSEGQLRAQAFREVTLPCPTWFMPRSNVRSRAEGGAGMFPEQLAEDMHYFYEGILGCGGRLAKVDASAGPLVIYRNHASNLSGQTPFAYLHSLRSLALQKLVLTSPAHPQFSASGAMFSIWNAGKAGKKFYRSLPPLLRERVREFADIDPRKLALGFFEAHEAPAGVRGAATGHGAPLPARRVPIVTWQAVRAPCVICVRQELEDNASQREFRHRIDVIKGWKEGIDYFFLS